MFFNTFYRQNVRRTMRKNVSSCVTGTVGHIKTHTLKAGLKAMQAPPSSHTDHHALRDPTTVIVKWTNIKYQQS